MKITILGLAGVATLAIAAPAFTAANAQTVGQREQNQQHRIVQGARSGSLTPGETERLEHRESNLHRHQAVLRAHDHGHLTSRDRHVLQHQENRDSRAIYNQKHNGRVD